MAQAGLAQEAGVQVAAGEAQAGGEAAQRLDVPAEAARQVQPVRPTARTQLAQQKRGLGLGLLVGQQEVAVERVIAAAEVVLGRRIGGVGTREAQPRTFSVRVKR